MFGLPAATIAVIFGIPAIWVIYTIVFVYLSRHWSAEDVDGHPGGDVRIADPGIAHRENGGLA
ncbi:hypothetical protein DFO66_10956 [Brevibacterium sanguinis]|uniref:Uncharacterized protein n=2 Tax=Brevibacterium TaxID=1696 RepID=A0A366IIJ3_9MICO|nr:MULTISPECIES: hypothetical protein [Brevibacterium]RBP63626.1 hypothetical protein DFO66_10956 [Brevibacterium sanguinis]RBP70285.1 hypothetical protein DFO65_10956 [Brevibacterium celere]